MKHQRAQAEDHARTSEASPLDAHRRDWREMARTTLGRSSALARATLIDIARRPGALLAVLGCAILLALVPSLAKRALDTGTGLASELALSTIGLFVVLQAAVIGPSLASPGSPLGPTTELHASPLSVGEYSLARLGGALCALAIQATLLSLVALICLAWSGQLGGRGLSPWLAATTGIVAQAAVTLALAYALGAIAGRQMGVILALAFVVLVRLAPPGLSATPVAFALPDTMRLDFSRDLTAAGGLSAGAVALAIASALLQSVGLAVLATVALGTERARSERP